MYFSNSDGHAWMDEQCYGCVHSGEESMCAVESIQMLYNYDQMKEGQEKLKEARSMLINSDGCQMRHVPSEGQEEGDRVLLAAANAQKRRNREASK